MRLCPFPVFAVIFSPVFVRPAKVFLALAVLSVAVGGCSDWYRVVDKTDTCGPDAPTPGYEIVNNTKRAIFVGKFGRGMDPEASSPADLPEGIPPDYPRGAIPPGGIWRGWLVDATFVMHRWTSKSKVSIVLPELMAIRLDQNTVVYYTGYPKSLSDELNSWLEANKGKLASSFYTPKPTADNMEAYGLSYIVRNAGKARLGLPATKDNEYNECEVYTSLDPQNRPHDLDFKLIFTINEPKGSDRPKKSDIVVSYGKSE